MRAPVELEHQRHRRVEIGGEAGVDDLVRAAPRRPLAKSSKSGVRAICVRGTAYARRCRACWLISDPGLRDWMPVAKASEAVLRQRAARPAAASCSRQRRPRSVLWVGGHDLVEPHDGTAPVGLGSDADLRLAPSRRPPPPGRRARRPMNGVAREPGSLVGVEPEHRRRSPSPAVRRAAPRPPRSGASVVRRRPSRRPATSSRDLVEGLRRRRGSTSSRRSAKTPPSSSGSMARESRLPAAVCAASRKLS